MSPLKYIFTYNTDKQVWSPKPTAPAIASGSADAGVAGYLLERQTRRGDFFFSCPFSHLLQQFSVAENLGMERSTVAKRKKKCL